MDAREKLAVHEAGHAIVGRELGIDVLRVTVSDGERGHCHYGQTHTDTLSALRSRLTMSVAGKIAEEIAVGSDWRRLPLHAVRDLEPTDYLGEVTNVFAARGDDYPRMSAYCWLDEATPAAGNRAALILNERWSDVLDLSARLLVDGEVDLKTAA
jgi:hypothetical protein